MMCIDTSPGAYVMQMAGKHARTRHGTYSMGVFDTWRASEGADINRPFTTARVTWMQGRFGRRGRRANNKRS